MKLKSIIFTVFFIPFIIVAQQHPSYTQYTLNRFSLNPAVAGIKPCSEIAFGNRRQWIGFENAPVTYFATFHTRLNKDDKYPKNFHGIGAQLISDRHGFDNNTYVKLAYAYHIKLMANYHLSIGIFGGLQRQSFSFNSVIINDKLNDPAINNEVAKTNVYPEVSPGGFIYNRSFYMGLSMLQTYPAKRGDLGTDENRLTPHFFLTGGYRFRGQNIHYIPSFLFNFSPLISPTMDLTLTMDYKETFSLALGSKYLNSAYATLQLRIAKTFSLGYSFEYALNEISNVAPITHEIILTVSSCSSGKESDKFFCPAYQ